MLFTIQHERRIGACSWCHVSRWVWCCVWDSEDGSIASPDSPWALLCFHCLRREVPAVRAIQGLIDDERDLPALNWGGLYPGEHEAPPDLTAGAEAFLAEGWAGSYPVRRRMARWYKGVTDEKKAETEVKKTA